MTLTHMIYVYNENNTEDHSPRFHKGPLAEKWSIKNHQKLVNPANKRKLDVIVVGTGLAGASALLLWQNRASMSSTLHPDSPRRAHSIMTQRWD